MGKVLVIKNADFSKNAVGNNSSSSNSWSDTIYTMGSLSLSEQQSATNTTRGMSSPFDLANKKIVAVSFVGNTHLSSGMTTGAIIRVNRNTGECTNLVTFPVSSVVSGTNRIQLPEEIVCTSDDIIALGYTTQNPSPSQNKSDYFKFGKAGDTSGLYYIHDNPKNLPYKLFLPQFQVCILIEYRKHL